MSAVDMGREIVSMDEWGKMENPCKCILVQKHKELVDAVKSNCVECKIEMEKDCYKCVFLKFS